MWTYGALQQVNGSNAVTFNNSGTSVNVTSNSSVALGSFAGFSAIAQDALLLQGNRQYTFAFTITAPPPGTAPQSFATPFDASSSTSSDYSPGSVTATINYTLFSGAATGGVNYFPPVPPVCSSDSDTNCNPPATPEGGVGTRRRLLGFEQVIVGQSNNSGNSASMSYTCANPFYPCNNSVLTVVINVPFSLADQPLVTLQIRVQDLQATVSSPQLTAAPSGFNEAPPAPSSSTGAASAFSDPRFHGFWHQEFYVGGRDGAVYSLISDEAVQLNALFVQLERVRCPVLDDGRPMERCHDHSGTFFGVLAFVTRGGDHVRITAGDVSTGFHNVTLNDRPLLPAFARFSQELFVAPSLSIRMRSARQLLVQVGLYEVEVDNVDLYVDVSRVTVQRWEELVGAVRPEGLIGRTWNSSLSEPVDEAEVELYREQDSNILGHHTARNRFQLSKHS